MSDTRRSSIFYLEHLKSRGVKNVYKSKVKKEKEEQKEQPKYKPFIEGLERPSENNKYSCLDEVKKELGECTRCGLHKLRNNIVFGEGNPKAQLMFVGEGPGQDEDESGRPFVGRAGQLLTKIIEAMSLKREDVYIANIVKCRPPGNRAPVDDEIIKCAPFLMSQISVIRPKVIVALGSPSTCTLLNEKIKISEIRGKFYDWHYGIKLMPTFHPAYLLRNPKDKGLVWDDMKKVMTFLGIELPKTGG